MKVGFLLSAFLVGCFLAVFMRANAPGQASAESSRKVPVKDSQTDLSLQVFEMSVTEQSYGLTKSGENVKKFVCTNDNGYRLEMIDFGATITSFYAPDRNGQTDNITLGCSSIEAYEICKAYLGSTVGRYSNRIGNARFQIDGQYFELDANDGNNCLHGGKRGFDQQIWSSELIERDGEVGVRFALSSPDGEGGFPGNLDVRVEYTLNNANEIKIRFHAESDRTTPVSLTNHAYWNLSGSTSGNILRHQLQIAADRYLMVDEGMIPTEIASVSDTPFDLRTEQTIGDRFEKTGLQPKGFDHCFVLPPFSGGELPVVARLTDPVSGRRLEVLTDQPGLQFYTGNFLDGQPSSGGYGQYQALCLEAQSLPDAPNRGDFPNCLVRPGEPYDHTTVYRFSIGAN
jgi:aldose 1-epimerase